MREESERVREIRGESDRDVQRRKGEGGGGRKDSWRSERGMGGKLGCGGAARGRQTWLCGTRLTQALRPSVVARGADDEDAARGALVCGPALRKRLCACGAPGDCAGGGGIARGPEGAFAGAAGVVVGAEGCGAGVVGFGQGLPGEANDGHDGWGGHPRGLGPSGVDEEAVDGEGVALTVGHGELVPGLGHPVGGAGGEPPTPLPLGILIPGDVGEVGPKAQRELGGGEEVGVKRSRWGCWGWVQFLGLRAM